MSQTPKIYVAPWKVVILSQSFSRSLYLYIVNNWNERLATFSFICGILFFPMIRNFPLPQLLLRKHLTLVLWSPSFKQPAFWCKRSLMGNGSEQQHINTSWILLTSFPSQADPSNSLTLFFTLTSLPLSPPLNNLLPFVLALFSSFPSCFIFCLPPWPLFTSYSCHQESTGFLAGCAGLLPTAALKFSRSVWGFLGRTITWEIRHT